MPFKVREEIKKLESEIIEFRRDFHKYPEVGFKEVRTQKVIEDFLGDLGIPYKKMAKTGIMATIIGGHPGKTVALRADMDALPVFEENEFDYKSTNEGIMHACGHDGHMAVLMGATKCLWQKKDEIKGNIKLIFQPAEEGIGGALPMIEEGCLKDPRPDVIYGIHFWGGHDCGQVIIQPGPVMGTTDVFKIEIIGKGGHGAHPEATVDSIAVAASFINSLQTVVSRNIDPFTPVAISIGTIKGGTNFNVIAPSVSLTGTIRSMSDEALKYSRLRMEELLKSVCDGMGAQYNLQIEDGYPTLVNDLKVTERVREMACDFLGAENVLEGQTLGGEDFAYFAKEIPACFFFLGCQNVEKGIIHPNHHPKFDIDDEALLLGCELLLRCSENSLKEG